MSNGTLLTHVIGQMEKEIYGTPVTLLVDWSRKNILLNSFLSDYLGQITVDIFDHCNNAPCYLALY